MDTGNQWQNLVDLGDGRLNPSYGVTKIGVPFFTIA